MKQYRVVLQEEAEDDLAAIGQYLAREASPAVAERYVEELLARVETLTFSPRRGSPRRALGRGVRSIVYKRTVVIVYRVRGDIVTIVGFLYRGRDVAAAVRGR